MGFFVVGFGSKTISGCTHVVKHLLFSKFSSILTFDFDLILVPKSLFMGLG